MIHATFQLFCRRRSRQIYSRLNSLPCQINNTNCLDTCQFLSRNLISIRLPQKSAVNSPGYRFQMAEGPCFSFGVIADIQYADSEDGYNYSKTSRRYYRNSLKMLEKAIEKWNTDSVMKPQFVLQLGDIIDGLNKRLGISDKSLAAVCQQISKFPGSFYHIWGNHEYYNFSRKTLMDSKIYSGHDASCFPVPGKCYYSCVPLPKLRIIALDTYEISLLASEKDTSEYRLACEYMENNVNEDKNSSDGLQGEMRRFVRFNGAVSEQQLDWIQANLDEARTLQQNVVIMGHCGAYGAAIDNTCLCWNSSAIRQLIKEYSDCVMCYFSGHDHGGKFAYDDNVLHMAFPGVLENNVDADFGTVYMYTDRMELQGNGRVKSLSLPLKFKLNEESIEM